MHIHHTLCIPSHGIVCCLSGCSAQQLCDSLNLTHTNAWHKEKEINRLCWENPFFFFSFFLKTFLKDLLFVRGDVDAIGTEKSSCRNMNCFRTVIHHITPEQREQHFQRLQVIGGEVVIISGVEILHSNSYNVIHTTPMQFYKRRCMRTQE